MLGALYGGRRAAETILQASQFPDADIFPVTEDEPFSEPASPAFISEVCGILLSGLGIVRNETQLTTALELLSLVKANSKRETSRLYLAEAMLKSALERRESRGAHYREDYPETQETYRKMTNAQFRDQVQITFCDLPERREHAYHTEHTAP